METGTNCCFQGLVTFRQARSKPSLSSHACTVSPSSGAPHAVHSASTRAHMKWPRAAESRRPKKR
jgi:hypothetical protein